MRKPVSEGAKAPMTSVAPMRPAPLDDREDHVRVRFRRYEIFPPLAEPGSGHAAGPIDGRLHDLQTGSWASDRSKLIRGRGDTAHVMARAEPDHGNVATTRSRAGTPGDEEITSIIPRW
jgi:hypothetical protein